MRRWKREMKDVEEIKKLIAECKVCRIGMLSEGEIYIVPMNFGYEYEEGKLNIYLHSAKAGRKIEAFREGPEVCVEMDGRHGLEVGDRPCDYSYYFASLIGNGKAFVLENVEEKIHGLQQIMVHQTGKEFSQFEEKWVKSVEVVKIEVEQFRCKCHAPLEES